MGIYAWSRLNYINKVQGLLHFILSSKKYLNILYSYIASWKNENEYITSIIYILFYIFSHLSLYLWHALAAMFIWSWHIKDHSGVMYMALTSLITLTSYWILAQTELRNKIHMYYWFDDLLLFLLQCTTGQLGLQLPYINITIVSWNACFSKDTYCLYIYSKMCIRM